MESTAFFEKKISLTPSEFNKVKNNSVDSLLEEKAKELVENKCSENGFILSGTVKLISRSMGYFEPARFTGDAVYYVKLEGKVIYPADGIRVVGEVIRKNKMGLYVDYRKAIRIQVPRDLHLGSEEFDLVEIGDNVEVELKRSKFQINDPYILASGVFIAKKSVNGEEILKVNQIPQIQETLSQNSEEQEEEEQGEEQMSEQEEEEEEQGEQSEDDEDEDEDEDETEEQE
jgi:hypothetical protein